jgi:hypothetical protein
VEDLKVNLSRSTSPYIVVINRFTSPVRRLLTEEVNPLDPQTLSSRSLRKSFKRVAWTKV